MNKKLKKGLTVSSAAAMGMSIVLPTVSVIAAPAVTNGWVNQNGTWYYYNNGTLVKNGWAKDSKGWCFLSAVDGSWVQEGWAKDNTGWGYIRNGYWVEHATWAKDANGWQFIGANGYWDTTVAAKATNPIDDATAAVVKAEGSKLAADVDAAKALVAALNDAIPEKVALTTRLNAVVTNFEVASVTAVDALHVKVVYTQAVDEATAEDTKNYTLDGNEAFKEAVLQEDGKTVILELNGDDHLTNDSGDDYTVKIADVENTSGDAIDTFKKVVSLFDAAKPTVKTVAMTNRDELKITFSEYVKGSDSDITVYNEDGDEVDVTVGDFTDDYVKITGLGDEDEGDYTVKISGVKDWAGNKIAETTEDFTLTEDNTDPDVDSVKAVSTTTLKVTFDEAVDLDNSVDFAVEIDNEVVATSADVKVVGGTDKKSWYVTVTDDADLYDNDNSYKVKVSGYLDFAGNEGDSFSKYLKFNDLAPAVESTEAAVKTFDGNKYAVITFDQDVNDHSLKNAIANASYTDEDGDTIELTSTEAADLVAYDSDDDDLGDYLDDNQIAIAIDTLEVGDYTVTLPDGFVNVNSVDSDETDITFSVTSKDEADVTVKKVSTYSEFDVSEWSDDEKAAEAADNKYFVYFSDEVGSSAIDVDNYEVDGDNIFTKAVFTDSDKDTVKLTVGNGQLDAPVTTEDEEDGIAFTSKDIQDADGNDVDDYNSADEGVVLTFNSTTGPELTKATLVDLNTVELTFDEAIDNVDSVDEDDFKVTVDGDEVDIDSVDYSVDQKVWTLTLDDDIDEDYTTVKAGTSADFDGEDAAGNEGAASVMKTAKVGDATVDNEAAAAAVVDLIDALDSEADTYAADVAAARDAYDDLTAAGKDLVTNYDDLTAAEQDIADLTTIASFDAIVGVDGGTVAAPTYTSTAKAIEGLPATVTATTASGGTVTVDVASWTDTDGYDATVAGSYTFTAVLGDLPDGYTLADGVDAPTVVVTVAP